MTEEVTEMASDKTDVSNPTEGNNPTEQLSETTFQDKQYIFGISGGDEGIQIKFDAYDPEGNLCDMSVVDVSMITLAIARLLKEEGFADKELKEFFDNVVKNAGIGAIVDLNEPAGASSESDDGEAQTT